MRQKNDPENIERYEKLLSDWKPGSPAPQPTPQAAPKAVAPAAKFPAGKSAPPENTPVPGAILLLSRTSLAIYLKYMPDKEYHLALMLSANGVAKPQGIALEGHQVEEIGSLPARFVEQLKQSQTWNRDLIVFHCYSYDDVRRLPANDSPDANLAAVGEKSAAPAPASPASGTTPEGLRRGQRLTIRFGANAWDAVYWGRDDQASVLAHKTHNEWALMHLDLERFQNDMQVSAEIDPALIEEIQAAILGQ